MANLYYYELLQPDGRLRRGITSVPAEKNSSANAWLERSMPNCTVVRLRRLDGWLGATVAAGRRLLRSGVDQKDLAVLLRDMGVMVEGGIPVVDAIRCIADDDSNVKVSRVCRQLAEDIAAGSPVSAAFARQDDVFPATVRGMVEIGDETGELGKMLMEAASHLERVLALKADSKIALIYPVFAFVAIFGVAAFWIAYVMPNLVSMFKQFNAKLPWFTVLVLDSASWLSRNFGWIAATVVLVAAGTVALWFRVLAFRRLVSTTFHHAPIIRRILTASGLAFYAEYLGILIRAGLDALSCLRILENAMVDLYYKERIGSIREIVARGERISVAMQMTGGFPSMMVRMIAVGEDSGTLDRQLGYLSSEYALRLKRTVDTLSEIMKPLVVVIAGGVFLVLIVALLLPVYDLVRQAMARPGLGGF